jgi:hypothetical protein
MKRTLLTVALGAAVFLPAFLLAQAPDERPLDPRVVVWDQGPDTIDVSKYPPEIRKKYRTFETICSRCHSLARAVNCDFVLEDDWERYIKRMMRRGRSLVTPEVARESYEFAVFDSKIRKRELYDRKLKESVR